VILHCQHKTLVFLNVSPAKSAEETGGSFGVLTRYGLLRSGERTRVESRFFPTRPGRPWNSTQSLLPLVQCLLPGGKAPGAGRWPPRLHQAPSLNSTNKHSFRFWEPMACSRVTFTFNGSMSSRCRLPRAFTPYPPPSLQPSVHISVDCSNRVIACACGKCFGLVDIGESCLKRNIQ
jgi:hypothetical protein